jgi:hypothetical protein
MSAEPTQEWVNGGSLTLPFIEDSAVEVSMPTLGEYARVTQMKSE